MKLIIDIPEEKYLYAKNLVNSGKENNPVVLAIGSGIPISDNATNGDVTKAMFDVEEYHLKTEPNDVALRFNGEERLIWFTLDWWNSPYQKGGK